MALYPRMRDLREDLDYSQAKMAAALGLYKTTYARYESGERDIPLSVAIKIAAVSYTHLVPPPHSRDGPAW